MGRVTVISNTEASVNLAQHYNESGWKIEETMFRHLEDTKGTIEYGSIFQEVGKEYTIRFHVSGMNGGLFRLNFASTPTIETPFDGVYEFTVLAESLAPLELYGEGAFYLTSFEIISGEVDGQTLVFSEKENKWVGNYQFVPDQMNRFKDDFFSFKNGLLWKHNTGERNTFYGEKHPTKVRFVSNGDISLNKIFYTIKIDGQGPWEVVSVKSNVTDQFPKGMESKIPSKNFRLIDGKYWADFFKDMNDPAFRTISNVQQRQLKALFEGRSLQGNYLEIELSCASDKPIRLLSVAVMSSAIERNF